MLVFKFSSASKSQFPLLFDHKPLGVGPVPFAILVPRHERSMAVRAWAMRTLQRANDGVGRLLLSPLSSAQYRHRQYHVPAVTRPSFVRPFTVSADDRCINNGGAPSNLNRQVVHTDDRCFNTSGFGQWTARGIHDIRLRMSSSISGEPTTKPDQPPYFEGPWYEKYFLLEQYKNEHGNCVVPRSFVYDDIKLGQWVSDQRYKRGRLSQNRREMLDALGFSWDPKGDAWERNFALLEQFKNRRGHCNVPKPHKEDGIKLGIWLSNQRRRREKLEESLQRRLEQLGVSWDPQADEWEQKFALLEQFKEREGHCNVPYLHEEDGINLWAWLDWQRQVRRKEKREGNLSSERIERLEGLGVSWDPWHDQWERNFGLLEQFKEREGHCNVPYSHEEDGIKLGIWLSNQRYKREKLEESLQRRLEQLGVSWNPQADEWEQKFALLEKFKEREGHCNVSKTYEEDGINLGTWLDTLRQGRKGNREGNLSSERIERLDEVGIRW